jgi:hypothetical protein
METHPGTANVSFVEDSVRWLTDSKLNKESTQCSVQQRQMREEATAGTLEGPAYVVRSIVKKGEKERDISTCSFEDYALLYGQTVTGNQDRCQSTDDLSKHASLSTPLFDEMNIWGKTFDKVRGTPLPELFNRWQPSAKILVTVRPSVDVVYSAYNHFGVFKQPGVIKGPEHFDELMRNLTEAWTNNNCTPKTYRSCLPSSELASAGDWLSRAIYSEYLTEWLDQFGCSQVHLSDVTEDPLTAVNSLYEFMGVPNEEAARAAVSEVYSLLNATQVAKTESNNNNQTRSRKNAMNKASYAAMLQDTRDRLSQFFQPYDRNLCNEMMKKYPCLKKVQLFNRQCAFL